MRHGVAQCDEWLGPERPQFGPRRRRFFPADEEDEWELVGLVGDVPDFFYRVLIPEEMTGWFWLKDVDPLELYRALLRDGIEAPELLSANAVGVQVLPMGWS